jgi:hypothetical protein
VKILLQQNILSAKCLSTKWFSTKRRETDCD